VPGIILTYNKKPNSGGFQNISNDIAQRMYNREEFLSEDIEQNNKISFKLICRNNDYAGISKSDEGFIAWFGRPLYKGNSFDERIFRVVEKIIDNNGIDALMGDISGHFHLAIYLKESGMCYVVCDKTSTQPFYYAETSDFISFSPEPLTFKALKKYNWRPSIRAEAVFEYMASGYLWGDKCFFKEVKRLGPGQFACIDRNGIEINSYWKMTFKPNQKTEQSLISELSKAIQKDISDLPQGKKILTLSGGYDSRALLGLLKDADSKLNTISYSFGLKANKGMDMDVGEYYADKTGVSHSYYHSEIDDSSHLISNINHAILATGGENYLSIFQDAFLGIEFYKDLAKNYDYMIRGDEVWGWGDLAVSNNMAFWESRLFNLNEILHPKKIMKTDAFDRGLEYIEEQRQKFIEECMEPDISANDLKDYLYWRHREARLLQNMAYFRRCYIPHFAPFLFDRTLDVIKRTPSRFRVQKNLFISMCKKMFPDLFLDKKAISPHASDVNDFNFLYKDKRFHSFIKGVLLEYDSDVFNDIFDRKSFESWIDNILDGDFEDVGKLRRKHDLKRLAISLIGRSNYLKGYMKSFMVKNGMNTFPVLNVNYLFRLVVLSLALQEYDKH